MVYGSLNSHELFRSNNFLKMFEIARFLSVSTEFWAGTESIKNT